MEFRYPKFLIMRSPPGTGHMVAHTTEHMTRNIRFLFPMFPQIWRYGRSLAPFIVVPVVRGVGMVPEAMPVVANNRFSGTPHTGSH